MLIEDCRSVKLLGAVKRQGNNGIDMNTVGERAEAVIIVNGHVLTPEQAMRARVAVEGICGNACRRWRARQREKC